MANLSIRQQRQIEALLRTHTREIREAFLTAIRSANEAVDRRALIRALESGNIEAAVRLFRVDEGVLFPLQDAVRGSYVAGGQAISETLPKTIAGQFGFNGAHLRAEAYLRQTGAALVTNINESAMEAARVVITEGIQENTGTRAIARRLTGVLEGNRRVGGVIGLTAPQAQAIERGMSNLSSGDPARMREYLRLKERNRNFDGMIRRAIEGDATLSRADLDRIRLAHTNRSLKLRGDRVARNEAFVGQAAGRNEAWRQVAERGDVEDVTIRWQHSPQINGRIDHIEMDGEVISIGQDFVLPDGTRMAHPHDPRGGPGNLVNCKCVSIYRPVVARR